MNSQGFPCFAGQRNPGLTQQIMKGACNLGHRQALSPETPSSHLAVHKGRVWKSREWSPLAQLPLQKVDSSLCSLTHAEFGLPRLGAHGTVAAPAQSSGQAAKPSQLPRGLCLLIALPWTPWPRLSALTRDSLELVQACLCDLLTGPWLRCCWMLYLYVLSCAGSFDWQLNTHNTFLKGRNNPPLSTQRLMEKSLVQIQVHERLQSHLLENGWE